MTINNLTDGDCGICANCAPQINGGSGFKNCAEAHAAQLEEDEMSPMEEIECDVCGFISTDPEGMHYCYEDNSND
ncbi:hypothetical protein KPL88_000646 [Salmonella enterica]|uniref:Uncharacterized protein n=2 Tax=Salmonella enterica TaxID=28901 RepID=A0A5U0WNG9_SALER|nr:hypothetical protein [Salmonella enterica]EBP3655321.1 hypothetical protein [Salmonella enterica subsp. enterica]EDA6663131.1 hypothetical protein [Salmonella enterica subsp. enterica serovar Muenster]EDE1802194.1 hypothetical protein [Salmonella enterica subsp. enterica serovar Enteritidis]EDS5540200.1 hypothetical protein [Salmonella enterica subsp. enterica serovar Uganda]EAA7948179.1 hypothetical protein [Salmonella enterica subsp. enterica serovar Altona]